MNSYIQNDLPPFRVVLVGRPNVGKSALFNRLARRRIAIVHDRAGVTRDKRSIELSFNGRAVLLTDTPGLDSDGDGSLAERMLQVTTDAVASADAAIFLTDGKVGVTPYDTHYSVWLKKYNLPTVLAVNKCESRRNQQASYTSAELGLGEGLAISALEGISISELIDRVCALMPELPEQDEVEREIPDEFVSESPDGDATDDKDEVERQVAFAILGRPNAGKSTLVNRILGREQMLTGPEAGITRDSIFSEFEHGGKTLRVWDTAGMRRRARVEDSLERLSVQGAVSAMNFADVVVLLTEYGRLLDKQDLTIANLAYRRGRALVIAVSKADQIEPKQREKLLGAVRELVLRKLPQFGNVPVVPVSGTTGKGVPELLRTVVGQSKVRESYINTAVLNRWLGNTVDAHNPTVRLGKRLKLRYITQVSSRPPSFILSGSQQSAIPDSYKRYLINSLRNKFDLHGVPVSIVLKEKENPYHSRS